MELQPSWFGVCLALIFCIGAKAKESKQKTAAPGPLLQSAAPKLLSLAVGSQEK
jgi:hypothetical protein